MALWFVLVEAPHLHALGAVEHLFAPHVQALSFLFASRHLTFVGAVEQRFAVVVSHPRSLFPQAFPLGFVFVVFRVLCPAFAARGSDFLPKPLG